MPENSLLEPPTNSLSSDTTDTVFTIATKSGTKYVNSIRELYYTLITIGIPPENISITRSTVLNKICPTINTDSLKIPKKSCAKYMRQAEMPTICSAHKASNLINTPQGHINTDGTTLHMKILIGCSISGTVRGVQEVSDGCAETMIIELDKQLAKLRNTANELNIPNANAINWTLIYVCILYGKKIRPRF